MGGDAIPWLEVAHPNRAVMNSTRAAGQGEGVSTTITVAGLGKSFGRVHAVRGLSFEVEAGIVTGFLGPNGAGKTTTLRMILGLVRPDAGEARIGDRRYAELEHPIRRVGAVLESTAFHPGRTARVHLAALCAAAGMDDARVPVVLRQVGLADAADRRVGGFSLGMRQRLALASALLGDPGVLILDEPANGLDPEGVHWLRGLLRELAAEGRTVLVSSHGLAEMEQTADHVVIIEAGRLVAQGPVAELVGGRAGLEQTYLDLIREFR